MNSSGIIFLGIWIVLTIGVPLILRKRSVHERQSIATGFGILGTFLGIAIGLYNFDANNIELAVPELLNGLRFAFYTSIIGMAWSLCIGMFSKDFESEKATTDNNVSDHDVLMQMVQQLNDLNNGLSGENENSLSSKMQKIYIENKMLKEKFIEFVEFLVESDISQETLQQLEMINNKISGDGDVTLLDKIQNLQNVSENSFSELQGIRADISGENNDSVSARIEKLREDGNNGQAQLRQSFDNFAEQMARNNTTALVEAIEQVMRDFNTQINEKLGDSFNDLNDGVKNLLEWQGEYRENIQYANNALQSSRDAMQEAGNAMGEINKRMTELTNNAASFDNTANKLSEALKTTGNVMVGMNELAEKLSGNGEAIREEIKQIVQTSIEELGDNLKGISEAMARDYKTVQEAIAKINNFQN